MGNIVKYSVGVDISHKDFVASIASIDINQNTEILSTKTFSNLNPGFESLLIWVGKFTGNATNIAFAMEATGVYFEGLAYYLNDRSKCFCFTSKQGGSLWKNPKIQI